MLCKTTMWRCFCSKLKSFIAAAVRDLWKYLGMKVHKNENSGRIETGVY